MIGRLLFVLALLLPVPAAAQSLAGSWALRLDGAVIMRFDLERDGQQWKGTWVKPDSFASDGKRFARLSLPAVEVDSARGATIGDWAELTFDDPKPGAVPDVFRFRMTAPNRAEMLYVGTGLSPFVLERVAVNAPLGPFQQGKVYGGPAPAANRPAAQGRPAIEGR
jgi:hypothetical protein